MIYKKFLWAIKRHPFLYITRFKLLSRNSELAEIENSNYNHLNSKTEIPNYFKKINLEIFPNGRPSSDIETAKQLSIWLNRNIVGGPGLSEPSDKALETMLSGKGGVCSDLAQIFNNFCVINDIMVREWGTTSAPFNRHFGGHSFNEVYVNDFDKWILIDASYNIFFYTTESDLPLSVVEMYSLKRSGINIKFNKYSDEADYVEYETINKNYLNKTVTPFLICNYRNKTYDYFLRSTGRVIPVFITHFIIYLLRKSYHYKFPLDDYRKIFN